MRPPRVPPGAAIGKWNIESASTTTAGDDDMQPIGGSETHRLLNEPQPKGCDGRATLRERLLRLLESNEQTMDRLEQFEKEFENLRGAFEELATFVGPDVSREIATRYDLTWFDVDQCEEPNLPPCPVRQDSFPSVIHTSTSCHIWRLYVSECSGLPRMRVFASAELKLRARLVNNTTGTSWTSPEVVWSDRPGWAAPEEDGLECQAGDEVRIILLNPDNVVAESEGIQFNVQDGSQMEVSLWRHAIGDSSLKLPSGKAVLFAVPSAPLITAEFRLLSIEDVDLVSDPDPSAVSVRLISKTTGSAQEIHLPDDPSTDAHPVELQLGSSAHEEILASLEVEAWGVIGTGQAVLRPSQGMAEEVLIDLKPVDEICADTSAVVMSNESTRFEVTS